MWRTRCADVEKAASQSTGHLRDFDGLEKEEGELDASLLRQALGGLALAFDSRYSGLSQAPKFPHPTDLRVPLRCWKRFNDPHAREMVRVTFDHRYKGGICDHLGGSFARYSTDERWPVPHFEKTLYDNVLLVPCRLRGPGKRLGEPGSADRRVAWTPDLRGQTNNYRVVYRSWKQNSAADAVLG